MESYQNTICITASELIEGGILTQSNYKFLAHKGEIKVLRRACKGNPALVEVNSLPLRFKEKVYTLFGNPEVKASADPFRKKITPDADAITYYSNYLLADGRHLPEKTQREYAQSASVLNALKVTLNDMINARRATGGSMKGFWKKALMAINEVRVELGHGLPSKETPLKRKFQAYKENGYEALVSKKFCNDNSRKVSADIENLLMSLYTMPNKPFGSDVHSLYLQFIAGKIQVADQKTGEIFDPKNFIQNGKPVEVCNKTVWNYLNQPDNRLVVDKVRSGAHRYNSTHRPHHHRHAPNYSFSKITMDDRDLPRKCENGKWVKAYYTYDVASGCVVGYAHSLYKDEQLFMDCMRDTFRLIEREGFNMPLEVEVENHLVRKFFDDLHAMFPYVRICNPGNSQEKHAEHFNRQKKYGTEKKTQHGIGRWWSRHEAYTVDRDKINDEFVEKVYTLERLIADDVAAIREYNNQPHPKQKKYPGKTRWQVLVENMNPHSSKPNKAAVYKSIGERVETTIRRNQYVTVQYCKYQIANMAVLERLLPGNYSVVAYYLPDTEGIVNEVFLWQNDVFLCKADKIVEYNTAKAEWNDKDQEAYTQQSSFVSQYDSRAKKGKEELSKPTIISTEAMQEIVSQEPVAVEAPAPKEESVDEMINEFDPEEYAKRGLENL